MSWGSITHHTNSNRLKGIDICKLATCGIQNFTVKGTMSQGPNDSWKRTMNYWFLEYAHAPRRGSEGPENARFLQIDWEFYGYKLDILDQSEIKWWDFGEYSCYSCHIYGNVLLFSRKPSGSRRESCARLLLTVTTRRATSLSWFQTKIWPQYSKTG